MDTVTEARASRLVSPDGSAIDVSVVDQIRQGPQSRQSARSEGTAMAFNEISAKYNIPRRNRRAIARDMSKRAFRKSREVTNAS